MSDLEELLELEYVSQRYGDMLQTFKVVIEKKKVLTERQRNLLEFAFFSVMNGRRASWQHSHSCTFVSPTVRNQYLELIEKEIVTTCRMMLNNLYLYLFPNVTDLNQVKRYHCLSSACYRYMSEVSRNESKKVYSRQAATAYTFYQSIDAFEKSG